MIFNDMLSQPIYTNLYSGFTTEVLIPFYLEPGNEPPNAPFTEKVRVNVTLTNSAGSETWHPSIDTGTCGYVISKDNFPGPIPADAPVGWEFLSSSKILYSGHWVDIDAFYTDAPVEVKARFPVLVVDNRSVCPGYDVTVDTNVCPSPTSIVHEPEGIALFGVGFGRQSDGQPQGDPDKNPFLNIISIDGIATNGSTQFRNGFTISEEGVRIGLTGANTAGVSFAKLFPGIHHENYPLDWAPVPSCISVNETQSCVKGTALIDTGIAHSYLTLPTTYSIRLKDTRSPSSGAAVKVLEHGSVMKIDLGPYSPYAAQDEFVVGDVNEIKNGPVPDMVITTLSDKKLPFVNTGRHFLRSWKVTFDAVGGRLGFKRV